MPKSLSNALTNAKVKSLTAKEKAYKVFDGNGLYLFITPSGVKSWRFDYRFNGKNKTATFGVFPLFSLAEAREKRDICKKLLAGGIDPMQQKAEIKQQATFKEIALKYWQSRQDITESYKQNAMSALERYVYKTIGDYKLSQINHNDIMQILKMVESKGKYEYLRKVKQWISVVFEYAIANNLTKENPTITIQLSKAFTRSEVQHIPALEIHELPDFFERLSYEEQHLTSVLALKMVALTAVRSNELRFMQWSEIDLENQIWRIPAKRMKRRKEHLVPLSPPALEIIKILSERRRGSIYVFESTFAKGKPISENAILSLIGKMDYKGKMTTHGWRSCFSTWANENEYMPDVIERQLAHVPANSVRAAYNRAEYLTHRRQLLNDWAEFLIKCGMII